MQCAPTGEAWGGVNLFIAPNAVFPARETVVAWRGRTPCRGALHAPAAVQLARAQAMRPGMFFLAVGVSAAKTLDRQA
jgi:hypothetical protein